MENEETIVRALNRIATILQIANQATIAKVRQRIRKHESFKAILDPANDLTLAGTLHAAVMKAGQSKRTFLNKATELAARGLLERKGFRSNVSYRSSGVV